jgi:hypothetical protein
MCVSLVEFSHPGHEGKNLFETQLWNDVLESLPVVPVRLGEITTGRHRTASVSGDP